MVTTKHCSYRGCSNDSRFPSRSSMNNKYGEHVFFVKFPGKKQKEERCRRWINACRTKLTYETLTYHHYICSLHFIGENGPTELYPDPVSATMSEEKRAGLETAYKKRIARFARRTQEQLEAEKDSVYMPQTPECVGNKNILQDNPMLSTSAHDVEMEIAQALINLSEFSDAQTVNTNVNKLIEDEVVEEPHSTTTSDRHSESTSQTDDIASMFRSYLVDILLDDPLHYTGIKSKELLLYIFELVKDKASRIWLWRGPNSETRTSYCAPGKTTNRKLSLFEEFLLTLMRNRRGTDIKTIAALFGVSDTQASNIFITWNLFLASELAFLRRFPSTACNDRHIPDCFKDKNGIPNPLVAGLRTILDATEFTCEKPSLPSSQRKLYSAYYNDNTYKLLIGCTVNGYINYTSQLWSGNVSDKLLVEKSGFLDLLEPGDKVMADKGFGIRGMLAVKKCMLVLPPFLKCKRLKPRGATWSRRVSNIRIHIERSIGRLKTFRILGNQLKLTQKNYMDSIVNVCVSLCNLGNPLVT